MSADSSGLAAVSPADTVSPTVDSSRHGLFRYLTADEAAGYLAIVDLFSAILLTDLSAVEVTTNSPNEREPGPRHRRGAFILQAI
jgi:hypothetical protein